MSDPRDTSATTTSATAISAATRSATTRDGAPRLEPLPVEAFTDELLAIVARMIQVNYAIDARDKDDLDWMTAESAAENRQRLAQLPEIIRTMLRHPRLFAAHADIGIQLLGHGTLSPRLRELAVLRIGWLCRAPYEWGEHVHVAKSAGLTSAEIDRITEGAAAPGWDELERAVLTAVDELHGDAMISDATWAALAARLDERQLIELPILVGQYQTVAYYQNSLRLRLHEGNGGLGAR